MIVNLTPHDITLIKADGKKIRIPSSGVVRCAQTTMVVGETEGLPIVETRFGKPLGLPEPNKDTIYIVSSVVAKCAQDRNDVFVPVDMVRDETGRIVGCKALGKFAQY